MDDSLSTEGDLMVIKAKLETQLDIQCSLENTWISLPMKDEFDRIASFSLDDPTCQFHFNRSHWHLESIK